MIPEAIETLLKGILATLAAGFAGYFGGSVPGESSNERDQAL